jgi:hypothetical protein
MNSAHFTLGYGLSDKPGYTLKDYADGTSMWHIHQDILQDCENERRGLYRPRPEYARPVASEGEPDTDQKVLVPVIPKTYKNSYAMCPYVLCSSLFTVTTRQAKGTPRPYRQGTISTTRGGSIEYRGLELWQEDESVLLGLVKLAQGMTAEALNDSEKPIDFAPTSFCSSIGWSDNSDNTERLKECLLRLRGAILVMHRTEGEKQLGCTVGFVKEFEWVGVKRWTVQLDARIQSLFSGHVTYINIEKRKLLSEGLQTWLYGLVCANNCAIPFSIETIHKASGSKAKNMQEFGRSVREAFAKLVDVKAIKSVKVKRGAICVFK